MIQKYELLNRCGADELVENNDGDYVEWDDVSDLIEWREIAGKTPREVLSSCPTSDTDCLVIRRGDRHIEHMFWNSRHKVWDQADHDDFCCVMSGIQYWMAFPELPKGNNGPAV